MVTSTVSPARNRARTGDGAGDRVSRLVVNGVLLISAGYFLLPLLWVIIAASKSPGQLFNTFGLWFSDAPQYGENLVAVFTQDGGLFGIWILNSLLYAGVGALVATIIASACGYVFAKYVFRGRETLFSIVLGGVLVPATIIALPLYFLLNTVGLTGSYWSVLLPSMVSPFGVYLARIHANASVPDEVIEAARLDGAGDVRIFTSIAARMMTPALVTIFLFQFVTIWNNYLLPLVMLNSTSTFPVTLGLTLWSSQTQRDPLFYQLVVTGSAVSVVILVALMISLQRFWKADLTAGATKG